MPPFVDRLYKNPRERSNLAIGVLPTIAYALRLTGGRHKLVSLWRNLETDSLCGIASDAERGRHLHPGREFWRAEFSGSPAVPGRAKQFSDVHRNLNGTDGEIAHRPQLFPPTGDLSTGLGQTAARNPERKTAAMVVEQTDPGLGA